MGDSQFDDIFSHMGVCGRFQVVLVVLLLLFGGSFQAGVQNVGMSFMQVTPNFECTMNDTDVTTYEPVMEESERCKVKARDSCHVYRVRENGHSHGHGHEKKECEKFEFNVSKYDTVYSKEFSSFVTEYGLVCSDSEKNTLTKSMYFIGFLMGALLGGYLSDNYGRRLPMMWGSFLCCLFSILAGSRTFSTTWWHYMIYRVLIGTFSNMTYIPAYVMIMESVGSESIRSAIGVTVQASFACGMAALSVYTYLIRDWRLLQIQFGLTSLPGLFMALFIPESVRYLVASKKIDQAKETVLRIGKNNGKKIYWDQLDFMDELKDGEEGGKVSIVDLFTYSSDMTAVVVNVILQWFANSTIYYGLCLGIAEIPGSIYVTNAIFSLIEIPSYALTIMLLNCCQVGRSWLHGWLMILTGTCCLVATFLSHISFCERDSPEPFKNPYILASFIFSTIGKFSVAASFAVIYNYTSELFPTRVRSNAVAVGSSISRIGAAASPFILSLYAWKNWVPGTLFGIMGLVSGVFTFKLPETRGHPMLMTFEEAQELYNPTKHKSVSKEAPGTSHI